MSQLLALEWNGSEARLAVGASRGGKVVIEQAFSVTLLSRQPRGSREEVDVGQRIAAALAARGISRIDTLVAVGRTNIELRQLTLPPAPEDELPELVRFQAMREFNELDEDWLLDFVPIDDSTEGPRNVLAAAIGPDLVGQIQQTCETANLKPQRLILRPCAAASLYGRAQTGGPARLTLLVDLLSDEVDLTVMVDRKVIFMRTTRLGGDALEDADQSRALIAEIRRTMAAAQNQLGGRRVESIVLCGQGEQHAALAKLIEQDLATPAELFDPFAGLNLGRELRRSLPDHPGRFAPLLGMLLAELERTGHAVDFLHPRRRPEPPGRHRKFVVAGVAAALLVLSYVGYGWMQRKWLNDEIGNLAKQSKSLGKEVERTKKAVKAVEEIEQWAATDVVWLDELHELSEDFSPAKEAVLTSLVLGRSSRSNMKGEMKLQGLAEDARAIGMLESRLRDESHLADGTGSSEDTSHEFYTWQFFSSVFVVPKEK